MPKIKQRALSYGEVKELERLRALTLARERKHSGKSPAPGSKKYPGVQILPPRRSYVQVERSRDNDSV